MMPHLTFENFFDSFVRATVDHDDVTAIVTDSGLERSFAEVKRRARKVAHVFHAKDIPPQGRVVLIARNGPWFHDLLFACAMVGAVLVPVNPKLSSVEVEYILDDARPILIFADKQGRSRIPQDATWAICDVERDIDEICSTTDELTPGSVDPKLPLLQIYTSGTTGQSKGALITHENLLAVTRDGTEHLGRFSRNDKVLVCLPLFHIAGIDWAVFALMAGSTTVLLPEVDAAKAVSAITSHRVTKLLLVPAVIRMLVELLELRSVDTSSVTTLCFGASPMPEELIARIRALFPFAGLIHVYGLTETSGMFTYLPASQIASGKRLLSCGIPFLSGRLDIVDPEGRSLAPFARGEIVYRGPQLMAGYWNKPEATEAAIRNGWFHTGDVGYRDDEGYLYVCDRLKDMVKSGDENVFPAEVENVVLKHPRIADAAIIGIPDAKWGELVTAVVVMRENESITLEELQEFARPSLAPFKLPRRLVLVSALPRNAGGKVLKHELRATYARESRLDLPAFTTPEPAYGENVNCN